MAEQEVFVGMLFCIVFVTLVSNGAASNSYLIFAPKTLHPGINLDIGIHILHAKSNVSVKAELVETPSGISVGSIVEVFKPESTNLLKLHVPDTLTSGSYRIQFTGTGGLSFAEKADVQFLESKASVNIQTDKGEYKAGQTINFRVFALYPNLTVYHSLMDIDIQDPNDNLIKQWRGVSDSSGVYTDKMIMDTHPVLGTWKINVKIKGKTTTNTVEVSQYVLPTFEVAIELPSYVLIGESEVHGTVQAMYTYGKPVTGIVNIEARLAYKYSQWSYTGWETLVQLHNVSMGNTFQQEESDVDDSDDIVSNFVLKSDLYSDISSADNDEELVMAANNAENDGQQKEINNNKSGRFVYPKTDDDIKQLVQKEIPKSTKNKTDWAVKLFENWLEHRNEIAKTDNEISKIEGGLVTMTNDQLNTVLGYFITEVRNKKGLEYYPNTLYELIICIQRFLRQNDRSISILDDRDFSALRSVLDSKMKELSRNGIGLKTKKADVISADQETYMWSNNILGTDTPKKLCDTLLYCIGLNFALRAGQEHRNLRVGTNSQISLKISPADGRKYLEYTEDVSKTNCGGLEHRQIQSKVVRAYQNTDCPERCIINMYQKYMSLRPNEGKCQAFYLRSKKYPTSDEWYDDCPIGVHQLQKTVSDLCKGAQFSGNFTNHSLRATAATRLYAAGVDEQLISEKTGHRSSAVRGYKRTCEDQLIMVDSVVNAKVHKTQDSTLTKSIVDKVDVKGDDPKNENGREISIDAGSVKINLKF